MNTQAKRIIKVLDNLKELVAQSDEEDNEQISEMLETGLNALAEDDFFGTEQQNDPRGDGRDSQWSMWSVEGIDEALGFDVDGEEDEEEED